MTQVYFVPANSIAQVGGVVGDVRDRLNQSSKLNVTAATTSSAMNSKFVSTKADVVVVMTPRHGNQSVMVGRGVFEAVQAGIDNELETYLLDPDTEEVMTVIDYRISDTTNYKQYGVITVQKPVMSVICSHLMSALEGRDRSPDKEPLVPAGKGYLLLALHLGIITLKT